jgi:hypothetical protein
MSDLNILIRSKKILREPKSATSSPKDTLSPNQAQLSPNVPRSIENQFGFSSLLDDKLSPIANAMKTDCMLGRPLQSLCPESKAEENQTYTNIAPFPNLSLSITGSPQSGIQKIPPDDVVNTETKILDKTRLNSAKNLIEIQSSIERKISSSGFTRSPKLSVISIPKSIPVDSLKSSAPKSSISPMSGKSSQSNLTHLSPTPQKNTNIDTISSITPPNSSSPMQNAANITTKTASFDDFLLSGFKEKSSTNKKISEGQPPRMFHSSNLISNNLNSNNDHLQSVNPVVKGLNMSDSNIHEYFGSPTSSQNLYTVKEPSKQDKSISISAVMSPFRVFFSKNSDSESNKKNSSVAQNSSTKSGSEDSLPVNEKDHVSSPDAIHLPSVNQKQRSDSISHPKPSAHVQKVSMLLIIYLIFV